MGETASNSGTPPQPQPPMGHRRPLAGSTPRSPLPAPTSLNAPSSSMPQRRPQLVRRVNTSQGRRYSGRDLSNASDGGVRNRCNSDGSRGGMRYEQIQSVGAHPPVATDMRLLLASLDKQAVEDEAEATLLDVLERRQVTFANIEIVTPSGHHHRLNRSQLSTLRPNGDSLNHGTLGEGSRPSQLSRSISHGQGSPPKTRQRNMTADADWAFHLRDDELLQALSDVSDQNSNASPLNHGNRHQRVKSALPRYEAAVSARLERGGSERGFANPGERARYVALSMKTQTANNMEKPSYSRDDNNFAELMSILEKQRDTDDNKSSGSQHNTEGSHKSGEGTRRIESIRNQSSFVSRGNWGYQPQRPLSTAANYRQKKSNIDHLFEVAEHVEELCKIPEEEEAEDVRSSGVLAQENATFLSQLVSSHPDVPPVNEEYTSPKIEHGGVNEQTPILGQSARNNKALVTQMRSINIFSSFTQPAPGGRLYNFLLWWAELRKQMRFLAVAFDGEYVRERLWHTIQNDLSMVIVPALAISAFLYYKMNNPILPIFPTNASISWWILFLLRHYVTLQMAYVAEYLIVDVAAVRSLLSVYLIGPLATLYMINARGWPFTLTVWGALNFLLIQGIHDNDNIFFSHWLYFTDIEMFTAENPSGSVVESDIYRKVLVAIVVVGVATSLKRTVLALYLSKRLYIHYKQRLEKVMETMLLLTEVANLGIAISDYDLEKIDSRDNLQDTIRSSTMIGVLKKEEMITSYSDSDEDDDKEKAKYESTANASNSRSWHGIRSDSNSSDENEPMHKVPMEETNQLSGIVREDDENGHHHRNSTLESNLTAELLMDSLEPPVSSVNEPVSGLLHDVSATARITSLLDGWEEPVNKADKMAHPTIHEILRFRKALTFLDDTHPFGSSFGPAFTRESCIHSSKSLYKRLLAFSPRSHVLHFDVIGVLAYNTDGTFDDKKAKSLVKLFRPDKFHEVSLLHFVQSCDGIYKRIRYLRASVGNSTLIDNVLENIFNGIFYFVLSLTIMTLLQMNPWTLLISMSTVLVSFAFALGPSAAKLIEGMIMIAVRRPFDLGDRISIVDSVGAPDNSDDPGYHDTWIVEDCNLFSTTLRLSRTNELSTVNNGTIANTRIVNHARSLNALVNIQLLMTIDVSNEKVQIVKSALLQYIRDNPRVWARLINFRIVKVDTPNHLVIYSARIEHVKSWQEILPILQARGDLEYFCTQILFKLDIHYDHYTTTNNVFIKEVPELGLLSNESVHPTDADSSADADQHQG